MNTIGRLTFSLFFVACIIAQGNAVPEVNNLVAHLERYSYIDEAHHDNIADTEHGHKHKHSENEEEHEHHHEHNTSPQSNLKLISNKSFSLINISAEEIEQNFFVELMVSTEHPFSIFRPPIS
jgi:ABC-type Zn2+ transport system substrate-binding protein/surface adhesin